MNQTIDIFGKDDIKPIFKEKVWEYTTMVHNSRRFTPAQREYLGHRMGTNRAPWYIQFAEQRKRDQLKAELAYWCDLYLRCLPQESKPSNFLSQDQIDRAKEYPTHELYDGRLIRSGHNFKALCPFHEERTASFYFYTKDNSYHCFGCAAHGGSAIDYLMNHDKYSFPDAVRRLI
ncbi:MAG: CHC2 zinc finger domain-containing protein [Candidatus Gottesmanbacteria bacterium]|nr:CHC2 zinc finger domain-containing protein [Candidatus Gottesmanbacteria bacterium]